MAFAILKKSVVFISSSPLEPGHGQSRNCLPTHPPSWHGVLRPNQLIVAWEAGDRPK
jgi:hypothetical protein